MNTQKTQHEADAGKSPVKVETAPPSNAQLLDSEVNEVDELAIDENFSAGGDPYNSTGKHVIIKSNKDSDE